MDRDPKQLIPLGTVVIIVIYSDETLPGGFKRRVAKQGAWMFTEIYERHPGEFYYEFDGISTPHHEHLIGFERKELKTMLKCNKMAEKVPRNHPKWSSDPSKCKWIPQEDTYVIFIEPNRINDDGWWNEKVENSNSGYRAEERQRVLLKKLKW